MIATYALIVMAAILIAAVGIELRTGRIPNWLTLLPLILFIGVAATSADRSGLLWQLGLAVAVFAFGLFLFAFAGFGAGAVKLMAGLALFVPLSKGFAAIGCFVGALLIGGFIIVNLRKAIGSENSAWHILSHNTIPMSLPLGITGLLVFFVI